uniref:Protein TIC 214 n=1 Tax=Haloragodendron glandulosum TaxID=434542 RepID=A0A8H2SHB5_9MAGN|nr:Ycf1 protein [Haloragodendron glandulosum]
MILKSFLLGNLVSLCMKIINSVVVVGLYYGFLTTFSIGPSYLFLLRARVMEEGTEKKVSATTGFITGQLMMFISIYYAPLHLALGRPHTITVLAIPYLLFHFFWNNHKHFLDYGSTTRNSMRNLSIQCVFLNNLIFQLFNLFILPSSMLGRLVNIYMFRCNNKMLFVTSSFVGWLIGHILFMKWVELVLVWIWQNFSIISNKYLVSEVRNSMARIFSILFFITCVYYLGRLPSTILTNKLKETSVTEERDVEIETTSETKGTKEEQKVSTEEDPSPSLFSEEKEDPYKIDETEEIRLNGKEKTKEEFHFQETGYKKSPVYETSYLYGNQEKENLKLEILKDSQIQKEENKNINTNVIFGLEKPIVNIFFDYKLWKRPFRYIKNKRFEYSIRNEMSQYFFYTCKSDGKQRICFTYPSSLPTFFEMIQRKITLFITEKLSSDELYTCWVYTNEQKQIKLSNEFIKRIRALESRSFALDRLTRLCNNKTQKEYLPKKYDPLLNGSYREKKKKNSLINENFKGNSINTFCINKIHDILFVNEYREFEHKKAFVTEIKNEIKKITKKVPRWSYKLVKESEQQERESNEDMLAEPGFQSKKCKYIVIFTATQQNSTTYNMYLNMPDEISVMRYIEDSDYRRDLIKGSMRAQRRKLPILQLAEINGQPPFFLDRIEKKNFFSFAIFIFRRIKLIFKNWTSKNTEFVISDYMEEERQEKEETQEREKKQKDKREWAKEEEENKERAGLDVAEKWDNFQHGQIIRTFLLLTQSFLRKYIRLPLLIIIKNICQMLLFQSTEWYKDFKDWNKEIHVTCTYAGIPVSVFPENWFQEGMQIKIVCPLRLKLRPRSKRQFPYRYRDRMKKKGQKEKGDFWFLTVWGQESEVPFGHSPKGALSFEPIFKDFGPFFQELVKELVKKIRKWKKKNNLQLKIFKVLKERTDFVLKISKEIKTLISKETKTWIIKSVLLINKIIKTIKEFFNFKINSIRFSKINELSETKKEKDLRIKKRNPIGHKSLRQIRSLGWTNYSVTEKIPKDLTNLTNRTSTIRKKIEKFKKEKRAELKRPKRNSSSKKKSNDTIKLESKTNIWRILKRKKIRLIRKSYSFLKLIIERIYLDIFLSLINIPKINAQLFFVFEPLLKISDKSIYTSNNKTKTKRIDITKKNTSFFLKSFFYIKNKNSEICWEFASLSQAYVLYKLSQNRISNLYNNLQHNKGSLFFKDEIKNYFETQRKSKLRDKKLLNSVINEWKNWLRDHYQYDLCKIRWSKLVPQNWRNGINQHSIDQNKNLNKWNSYKELIHYEKETDYTADSLVNQKDKFRKHYRYDILLYQYIYYTDKKDSYTVVSPLQVNNNQEILYNFNTNTGKFFDMSGDILINNYIKNVGNPNILDIDKKIDRKYFDWRILDFCLNLGMNQEILKQPSIFNLEGWLFPNFILLFNVYKRKPWVIPIKLLLFHFNENISENKNRTGKPKTNGDIFISSNKKKILEIELETQNQEEKERLDQGSDRLVLSNHEKDVDDDYTGSDIKKGKKKKKYKKNLEIELDFLLERYLFFQLRPDESFYQGIIKNIKLYGLLFRLKNPKEVVTAYIQREEMNLDIILITQNFYFPIRKLMKRGIFHIEVEPARLSVKNDGKFFMYQTLSILLSHSHKSKSKYQKNQRYPDKRYVHKHIFDKSTARHQRITGNRDKKNYEFLILENILSTRRRRELRILICLFSRNINNMDINPVVNSIKNCGQFLILNNNKHCDKLKIFLWPNYRLEDLACMNRYWFDTNNGSRFSMVRIHMYN